MLRIFFFSEERRAGPGRPAALLVTPLELLHSKFNIKRQTKKPQNTIHDAYNYCCVLTRLEKGVKNWSCCNWVNTFGSPDNKQLLNRLFSFLNLPTQNTKATKRAFFLMVCIVKNSNNNYKHFRMLTKAERTASTDFLSFCLRPGVHIVAGGKPPDASSIFPLDFLPRPYHPLPVAEIPPHFYPISAPSLPTSWCTFVQFGSGLTHTVCDAKKVVFSR